MQEEPPGCKQNINELQRSSDLTKAGCEPGGDGLQHESPGMDLLAEQKGNLGGAFNT